MPPFSTQVLMVENGDHTNHGFREYCFDREFVPRLKARDVVWLGAS